MAPPTRASAADDSAAYPALSTVRSALRSDVAYSEADFRVLLRALQHYADDELDQWASWRMESKFGDVFVSVAREPAPGAPTTAYDLVSPDMALREDSE
jgi:hypothetical protein